MRALRWTMVRATMLAVAVPGALSAQDKCQINDGSPYQVNGGKQYVLAAANSRRPDEVPKHLANAIRVLTDNPEKISNEPGRQWVLGSHPRPGSQRPAQSVLRHLRMVRWRRVTPARVWIVRRLA